MSSRGSRGPRGAREAAGRRATSGASSGGTLRQRPDARDALLRQGSPGSKKCRAQGLGSRDLPGGARGRVRRGHRCAPPGGQRALAARPPNIVLILTDDQPMDTLQKMPNVRALAGRGMTFRRAVVSNSLCCPSRATLLTGLYAGHTGVWTNGDGSRRWGGWPAFRRNGINEGGGLFSGTGNNEGRTLALYLQQAGYRTGLFGKYMNHYEVARRGTARSSRLVDLAFLRRGERPLLRVPNQRRRSAAPPSQRAARLLDECLRAQGAGVPALAPHPGRHPAVLPVLHAVRAARRGDAGATGPGRARANIVRDPRVQRARRAGQAAIRPADPVADLARSRPDDARMGSRLRRAAQRGPMGRDASGAHCPTPFDEGRSSSSRATTARNGATIGWTSRRIPTSGRSGYRSSLRGRVSAMARAARSS